MTNYLYFCIATILASLVMKGHWILYVIVIGGVFSLVLLPSTGLDYDFYKQAYENSFLTDQFPWVSTQSTLTAEPLYKWYSSFISVFTGLPFSYFLAINFLICFFISVFCLKNLKLIRLDLFWIYALPVIFPTLFYFSPRSSISFFLIFLGLMLLIRCKPWLAMLSFFIGSIIHSQYILFSFYIIVVFISYKLTGKLKPRVRNGIIFSLSLIMGLILVNISQLISVISLSLESLPSSDVAVSKLHYFNSAKTSYRATAFLSIVVYPLICVLTIRKKKKNNYILFSNPESNARFDFMVIAIVLFGLVLNVIFFNTSHLAGRLSRFSDYFSLGILIPLFFIFHFNRSTAIFAALTLTLLSPFIYTTLYT